MKWLPDNTTGFAKLFKVHLTFESTIYETVAGCESVKKKKITEETSESEILLKNLQPYSYYSVRIESQNSYGISEQTKKHSIRTHSASPSPPMEISIEFNANNESEVLVTGNLKWSPPCHPNGIIEFYTTKLTGKRDGYSEHSRNEVSFATNFTFSDLKRGYEYEFEVKAKNSESFGKSQKFSFKAPSGSKFCGSKIELWLMIFLVPLEADLENWTLESDLDTFEGGTGEIFIRRGSFMSEVGDITGVTFLVYLAVS